MSQFSTKRAMKYFKLARTASLESDFPQHKLGAVLVYKGIPLAHGHNSQKTSPVQKHYNRERDFDVDASCVHNTLHAEVSCLNKVRYLDIDFSKAVLFVYREHRNGVRGLARPCKACSKMIQDMGIRTVYYTTENGYCCENYDWRDE